MHPEKLFREMEIRTGFESYEVFDPDLKNKLVHLHPLNFIKTKITLPIFRIRIGYETSRGNWKESDKYMILDSPPGEDGECGEDCFADMYVEDYANEHGLKNVRIVDSAYVGDAVLPIG